MTAKLWHDYFDYLVFFHIFCSMNSWLNEIQRLKYCSASLVIVCIWVTLLWIHVQNDLARQILYFEPVKHIVYNCYIQASCFVESNTFCGLRSMLDTFPHNTCSNWVCFIFKDPACLFIIRMWPSNSWWIIRLKAIGHLSGRYWIDYTILNTSGVKPVIDKEAH